MTEAEIRERAKGVKENPPPRQAVEIPTVIVFKGMIRREPQMGLALRMESSSLATMKQGEARAVKQKNCGVG